MDKVDWDYNGRKSLLQEALEVQDHQSEEDVRTGEWIRKFHLGNECQQLKVGIHRDNQGSCIVGGGVRMERTKRLGRGV